MFPGVNPRQMQQMMKKMGIQQVDLSAVKVTIELEDGSKLVFHSPSVSKVNMMGQQTYQIVGEPAEETAEAEPEISEDDIKTVMDQAHVSKERALAALSEAQGDLAQAILNLKNQ